jgi:CheY-like chemotaxis protein
MRSQRACVRFDVELGEARGELVLSERLVQPRQVWVHALALGVAGHQQDGHARFGRPYADRSGLRGGGSHLRGGGSPSCQHGRALRPSRDRAVPRVAGSSDVPAAGLTASCPAVLCGSHSSILVLGYAVVEATSAEEALRLVNTGEHFDLLVTDHLMPGMSGTDPRHRRAAPFRASPAARTSQPRV